MKRACGAALLLGVVSALAASPAPAALPPYRLDWLGPFFYPYAINDRGQIVGAAETKRGKLHAVLWTRKDS